MTAFLLLCSAWFAAPERGLFLRFGGDGDQFFTEVATCIFKSGDGLMWFGTQRGLVRFDGLDSLRFRHDPNDPKSLSSDNIDGIVQDAQGLLWVGTIGGGVNLLDPVSGDVRRLPAGAAGDRIWLVFLDAQGNMWVGGEQGLDLYPEAKPEVRRSGQDFPGQIHAAAQSLDGTMWFAAARGGLFFYDGFYFHLLPGSQSFVANALAVMADGRLWAAGNQGLAVVVPGQATGLPWTLQKVAGEGLPSAMTDMVVDWQGRLWFSTDHGLFCWSPDHQTATRFATSDQPSRGPRHHGIGALFVDRQQRLLWLATEAGGVDLYNGMSELFRVVPTSQRVTRLAFSPRGDLWIGTGAGLLIDPLSHFPNNPVSNSPGKPTSDPLKDGDRQPRPRPAVNLQDGTICALLFESEQLAWVGTTDGLYRYDGSRFEKQPIKLDGAVPDYFPIWSLLRGPKHLWLGTEQGLFGLDTDQPNAPLETLYPDVMAIAMTRDHQGTIWLGTYGKGLIAFPNGDASSPRVFEHRPSDLQSLSADDVLALEVDTSGALWAGTGSGGLNRIAPGSEHFARFHIGNGFPDNSTVALAHDQDGLWVHTGEGLVQLKSLQNDPHHQGAPAYLLLRPKSEGLDVGPAMPGAIAIGETHVAVGGFNGYATFRREALAPSPPPRLAVTAVWKAGRQVAHTAGDTLLLRQAEQSLEFEVALLDYLRPERNRVGFRRSQLDQDFRQFEGKTRINFDKFASYGFEDNRFAVSLQGRSSRGQLAQRSLTVEVEPPFWRRWIGVLLIAAQLAVVSVFALLSGWYNRKKSKQLLQRAALAEQRALVAELRRESEMVERRRQQEHTAVLQGHLDQVSTGIANELHDGPLAELTGLGFRLHAFGHRIPEPEARREMAQLAEHTLPQINARLRDICGNLLLPDFELGLKTELENYADVVANSQPDIALAMQLEADPPGLSAAAKIMLYRIFRTLLQNAVKHAHANQIRITYGVCGQDVVLSVADDGRGFEQGPDFETLKRNKRYGLVMARYFAESMQGRLEIETQKEQGSRVTVIVPLVNREPDHTEQEAP